MPTTKGGDNSIQGYGVESASDERVQAATTVKAYLDAQVAGRWKEACSYLAAKIETNLEGLSEASSALKGKGCAGAMEAFMGKVPKGALRTVADLHVLSMRVQGDRGFLIYEDGEGSAAEIPMEREDGQWRVRALIAKDLLLG